MADGIGHCDMEDASGASRSCDMASCAGMLAVPMSEVECYTSEFFCLDTSWTQLSLV